MVPSRTRNSCSFLRGVSYLLRSFSRVRRCGRPLDFPLRLQVQTQSSCNGSCLICPYPLVRNKFKQGVMDKDLFKKIAREAAQEPLFSSLILMLQNEPLLDKRVFEFVRYFKSLGGEKECVTVTNGERIDAFDIEEIVQSGLDRLAISLNAHSRETFELINRGIDYERVMRNIDALISHDELKSKVVINFVLSELNREEIGEAVRYWVKRGVRVTVTGMSNRAGLLKDHARLSVSRRTMASFRGCGNSFASFGFDNILRGCPWPFYGMHVLFNGDVITCCHDWNRDPIVGNVAKDSLKSIWHSSQLNDIRRSILKGRYEDIAACKECSLSKRPYSLRII